MRFCLIVCLLAGASLWAAPAPLPPRQGKDKSVCYALHFGGTDYAVKLYPQYGTYVARHATCPEHRYVGVYYVQAGRLYVAERPGWADGPPTYWWSCPLHQGGPVTVHDRYGMATYTVKGSLSRR